jgi:hypothetical protein
VQFVGNLFQAKTQYFQRFATQPRQACAARKGAQQIGGSQ